MYLFKGDFMLLAFFSETHIFIICHLAMVAQFVLELCGSEVGVLGLFRHDGDLFCVLVLVRCFETKPLGT